MGKVNSVDYATSAAIKISELKAFVAKNGRFPKNNEESKLYIWITIQRSLYKKNEIDENIYKELDKLGMVWDYSGTSWNAHYNEIKRLLNTEKSSASIRKNPPLSKWLLDHQRYFNLLDEDKKEKIEELLKLLFITTGEKEYKRPNQREEKTLKERKTVE